MGYATCIELDTKIIKCKKKLILENEKTLNLEICRTTGKARATKEYQMLSHILFDI